MTSSAGTRRATSVEVRAERLIVELEDGRQLSVPLSWFPRLADASQDQLRRWRLIGDGEGIHWPDVDEDVSVYSLLHPEDTIPSREIRERERSGPRAHDPGS